MSPEQITHPSENQLSAFAVGNLSQEALDEVEQHLSTCDQCFETVQKVSDDSFVDLVRSSHSWMVTQKSAQDFNTQADVASSSETPEPLSQAATGAYPLNSELGSSHEQRADSEPQSWPDTILKDHPRYHVEGIIGMGGMGAVYKAEHRIMQRTVALKVISKELVSNATAVQRFHREVQAASRLDHPNIVRAHDADQDGEVHFFVMEFVQGTDLHQVLTKNGPLPMVEACEYVRQTALGLQHAHENGMVHRDVKPQNLMLTPEGHIKILDFGLASLTSETVSEDTLVSSQPSIQRSMPSLTEAGVIMGTPDYVAPEQTSDASSVDIRADIYSLGCTLYCLLTDHVPFPGGTAMDKVLAHNSREPQSVQELRPEVSDDLRRIVEKMMAKNPDARYQTPAEVAEALAPFTKATVAAERATVRKRRVWPMVAGLVGASALVLAVIASVIYLQTPHGTVRIEINDPDIRVRFRGETFTVHNDGRPIKVRAGQYSLQVTRGDLEFSTQKFTLGKGDNSSLVVEFLKDQKAVVVRQGGREMAKHPVPGKVVPPLELVRRLSPHSHPIRAVGFLSNGTSLVVSRQGITTRVPGLNWFDVSKGIPTTVHMAAISPDEQYACFAGHVNGQGKVRLWRLNQKKNTVWMQDVPGSVILNVAFVPNGGGVVVVPNEGPVLLLDLQEGEVVKSFGDAKQTNNHAVAVSPDGDRIFYKTKDNKGAIYHIRDKSKQVELGEREAWAKVAVWTPDGQTLITGDDQGKISRWNASTGKLEKQWSADTRLESMSIVGEGKWLLCGGTDRISLWDVQTGELLTFVDTPKHEGLFAALAPDGKTVISGGGWWWDGKAYDSGDYAPRVWELPKNLWPKTPTKDEITLVRRLPFHDGKIEALDVSSDGKLMVSADNHGNLCVWSTDSFQKRKSWKADGYLREAKFTHDGKRLVTLGTKEADLQIWDVETGRQLNKILQVRGASLAISPDDRYAFVGRGQATFVDLTTGKVTKRLDHGGPCVDVRFMADGKRILSARGNVVWLLDASDGKAIWERKLEGWGTDDIVELAVSSDEKYVAAGGRTDLVIANASDGSILHELKGHRATVNCLAFTRDGRHLITGSDDRTLRIWDVATGKEKMRTATSTHCLNRGILLPDGKTFVGGGGGFYDREARKYVSDSDTTLHVWRLPQSVWPKTPVKDEITLLAQLKGHENPIRALRFEPDGKHFVSVSRDDTVRRWAIDSQKEVDRLNVAGYFAAADISEDSRLVAVGTGSRDDKPAIIEIWDRKNRRKLHTIETEFRWFKCMTFSSDTRYLAVGGSPGRAVVWDLATGKQILKAEPKARYVSTICFSPDNQTLLFACADPQKAELWRLSTKQKIRDIKLQDNATMFTASFSPDAKQLAIGNTRGALWLYDSDGSELLQTFSLKGSVHSVRFLKQGRFFLAATVENKAFHLYLCDSRSGKLITETAGPGEGLWHLAVSPDGKYVVSGGGERWSKSKGSYEANGDYALRLWRLPESVWPKTPAKDEISHLQRFNNPKSTVQRMGFTSNGRQVYSMHKDGVRFWDIESGELISHLDDMDRPEAPLLHAHVTSDGKRVFSTHEDGKARFWDVASGKLIHTSEKLGPPFQSQRKEKQIRFTVSPDGRFAVTSGKDLVVWDLADSKHLKTITRGDSFEHIYFSPNGKLLAVCGPHPNHVIRVLKTADWSLAWQYDPTQETTGPHRLFAPAFTSDSQQVLSRSSWAVRVWDAPTGNVLRILVKGVPLETANNLDSPPRFSRDGRWVVSPANNYREMRVWSTTSEKPFHLPPTFAWKWGDEKRISKHVFSDGSRVILSNYTEKTGPLTIHELKTGKELFRIPKDSSVPAPWTYLVLPDERHLVTGHLDETIRIWNLTTGRQVARVDAPGWAANKLVLSPDGKQLLSAGGTLSNQSGVVLKAKDFDLHLWRLPESVWPDPLPILRNRVLKDHTSTI